MNDDTTIGKLVVTLILMTFMSDSAFAYNGREKSVEAKDVFDSLYKNRIQRVSLTRTTDDDAALAEELISDAGSVEEPALVHLMLDHANRLASKTPVTYRIAIRAMRIQADRIPERRIESLERVALLQQRLYLRARRGERESLVQELSDDLVRLAEAHGEARNFSDALKAYRKALALKLDQSRRVEIREAMTALQHDIRKQIKLRSLESKLAKNPDDADAVRDLALFHVVEMNDPHKASVYVANTGDEVLVGNLRLATTEATERDAASALRLANWYLELSRKAQNGARVAMLQHAYFNYEIFLQLHSDTGSDITRAKLAVNTIKAELKDFGADLPSIPSVKTTTTTTVINTGTTCPNGGELPIGLPGGVTIFED